MMSPSASRRSSEQVRIDSCYVVIRKSGRDYSDVPKGHAIHPFHEHLFESMSKSRLFHLIYLGGRWCCYFHHKISVPTVSLHFAAARHVGCISSDLCITKMHRISALYRPKEFNLGDDLQ